ncbi:unnamed protein product, partial [marine sediment metagenome]
DSFFSKIDDEKDRPNNLVSDLLSFVGTPPFSEVKTLKEENKILHEINISRLNYNLYVEREASEIELETLELNARFARIERI